MDRHQRRQRRPAGVRIGLVAAALALAITAPAGAHPAPFSFLDLHLDEAGLRGSLVLHDLDVAHDLEVEPPEQLLDPVVAGRHRARIEALMDGRLELTGDNERRRLDWTSLEVVPERFGLRLSFAAGPRPSRVDIRAVVFPYDPIHQTFVNVHEDGVLRQQAILTAEAPELRYFAGTMQGRLSVARTFVASGVEHILIGPDHVLFIVGLLLLGGSLPRLAVIVTAFTLGHSLTLSLAVLDLVNPSPASVEPLIALTIVVVGTDNLLVLRERRKAAAAAPAPIRDARPLLAGAFGLVHGFGFASVLREFGLPPDALGWSLASFNVGVELGQLAIVVTAAAGLALLARRQPAASTAVAWIGSVGVVLAGTWWFVERVFWSRP